MIIGVDSASSEEKVLSIAVNGAFFFGKSTMTIVGGACRAFFHSRISRRFFSICFFKVSTEADDRIRLGGVFMQ